MKHKHAELIKAWADGAKIEARYLKADGWTPWELKEDTFYWFDTGAEYRIKPEPKPDWIEERTLFWNKCVNFVAYDSMGSEWLKDGKHYTKLGNFKLTFDGETREVKLVEVIK
jgi:hypothetical protein